MRATKNIHHINIDETKNWEIELGGKKLFFDPEYRPLETVIQHGVVMRPAMSITKQPNMTIPEEGDLIYFHHQVFENKVELYEEDSFRWATHSQVYFILRDKEMIMLNDFILIKPKMETEDQIKISGIMMKPRVEKIEQRGYIQALSSVGKAMGLKEGQEVAFTRNADYPLDIQGEEYYLMNNQDIVAIIEDEVATPIGEWSLIEPLDEQDEYYETETGLFLMNKHNKNNKHRGLIHKTFNKWLGIKDGDKVVFDRKGFYSILVNNTKYYGVNAERDIFILL